MQTEEVLVKSDNLKQDKADKTSAFRKQIAVLRERVEPKLNRSKSTTNGGSLKPSSRLRDS